MKPSITPSLCCGITLLVVPRIHSPWTVGANDHFADFADRHLAVVFVYQSHINAVAFATASATLSGIRLRDNGRTHLCHIENGVNI